jgi:hypothetical protein
MFKLVGMNYEIIFVIGKNISGAVGKKDKVKRRSSCN